MFFQPMPRASRMLLAFVTAMFLWMNAGVAAESQSAPEPEKSLTCRGRFMNPITDICWSCVFPLKFGSAKVMGKEQDDTAKGSGSLFCTCETNGGIRFGLRLTFWEPARIVEVVRKPYCFPSLGGMKLDLGIKAPEFGQEGDKASSKHAMHTAFYQVHWYINPVLFWLQVLVDDKCLEQNVFDLAYLTEVDPLWADDEATFILNPDAALFANLPAQAICAGDCVAATLGMPLNQLFWCAGCHGSMYPLTGWVPAKYGGIQASSLITARFTNKMHREFLIWAANGDDGLCSYYPQPIMDKTNYKYQMVYPSRQTGKIMGKCCQPYGRSEALWGAGKEFIGREDFAYQIFRQRTCCEGAVD